MELQESKKMSSREIADATGKRHADVMRDIRNLLSQLNGNHNERMSALVKKSDDEPYHRSDRTQYKYLRKDTMDYIMDHAFEGSGYSFRLSEYSDMKGEKRPEYLLTQKDVLLLITGYDAVLRSKVINRWEELEKKEQRQLTPAEMLLQQAQMMVEQEKRLSNVENQLKQIEAKSNNHDSGYYSIMGYASLIGKKVDLKEAASLGRKATQICNGLSVQTGTVPDPRFGRIKTYPEEVLNELFNSPKL